MPQKRYVPTYINALHYGTLQIQPYCPGSVIYLFPDSTHCASFFIVIPVFSQRQKYLMSKSQNCAIQFIHQIPSFFVIIQKQKLSISSLSELVKKAESPKILLLNFFREIIFTKKLFSRKIQFFYSDNNKMYVYYCFTSHEFLHPRPHRYHLRQFHHGSHH